MFECDKDGLEIIKKLKENGYKAYFVGGCVRDMVLKRKPKDWDIATNAKPEEVLKVFPKTIETGLKHGTVTVVQNSQNFEVTTFRKDVSCDGRHAEVEFSNDLYEDCARRDFTMNAMAYNPIEEELIDYFDGVKHIQKKLIVAVGNPEERIKEDYLRMLRAARFKAQLGFNLRRSLEKAIVVYSAGLSYLSGERIRDELMKILQTKTENTVKSIKKLHNLDLLNYILPEICVLYKFSQESKYHSEDVFIHSLNTLKRMCQKTEDPILRFAALIHDIGKYGTRHQNQHGYSFIGHDKIGVELANNICFRLKLSRKETELIKYLVKHHMDIKNLTLKSSKRTKARFIRKHEKYLNELLLLGLSDIEKTSFDGVVSEILDMRVGKVENSNKLQSLLNGKEIMDILKIEPGKRIGEIKNWLIEEQLKNSIIKKEEAIIKMKEKFKQ